MKLAFAGSAFNDLICPRSTTPFVVAFTVASFTNAVHVIAMRPESWARIVPWLTILIV